MKSLNALTISIPVLAAVTTALVLGPLAGYLLLWTIFIAWGAFFALGASIDALKNLIICGIFGALLATIGAMAIIQFPIANIAGLAVGAALWVLIGVAIVVAAANLPLLSTIPATVFGFASVFAVLLQTPGALTMDALTSISMSNVFVLVALSFIVGGVLGLLSAKWAAAMTKAEAAA